MQKKLTDLKRALSIGAKVTQLSYYDKTEGGKIGIERFVVKIQTNGVYLSTDPNNAKGGSFLDLPKASLLDYQGDIFKIYTPGLRDLTPEEMRAWTNRPSARAENTEKLRVDMISDGSQMYYQDQKYFADLDMRHLSFSEHKGMRLDYDRVDRNKLMVRDDKVKGDCMLSYKVTK